MRVSYRSDAKKMSSTAKIYGINGPVVTLDGAAGFSMQEMVFVGKLGLVGEVISIGAGRATIQVYESTTSLRPGEEVVGSGMPISVTLGPGIIGTIFDGIQRPLKKIEERDGHFISRGGNYEPLDAERLWEVKVKAKCGAIIKPGDIYATCEETPSIEHRCLVPPGIEGEVVYVAPDGKYRVNDTVIKLRTPEGETRELSLCHKWPIRVPRPIREKLELSEPLVTGQRVLDSIFPLAKGGTAALPGGFGAGKTMVQHQIAKGCDADIIIYVGCGERGNEMTQVLEEFSELVDPRTGHKLTDRTVLIANTSNMPVAAREASIYTGITIAEYYRDMGYHVAMMADSTSRWAEALREVSGRLEEMPAEEGFPAYLPSRLAAFYERAGRVMTLGGDVGSVTVIGAVSPTGADFSEPVTQATKRFTRCFWALDKSLAYSRHYPAVNWTQSYSEYIGELTEWYDTNVAPQFSEFRARILRLLAEETSLMEIVKLIGSDVLPDDQKLIIEIARVIRIGLLQQDAYNPKDTYSPIKKQFLMMKTILHLYDRAKSLVEKAVPISRLLATGIFEKLEKMKYEIPSDRLELFDEYIKEIDAATSTGEETAK